MPSHYHEEEYYGNEDAARIFKAPPKEKTEGEKLEEKGGYIDEGNPVTDDNLDQEGRPSLMIGDMPNISNIDLDAIKEVAGDAWDFTKGFLPDPTNVAEMSEHFAGIAQDARAFKTAAMASPVKHPVAMGAFGVGGIALRRTGAEALKPIITKGKQYINDLLDGIWNQPRFAQQQVNLDGTLMMSKGADDIPLSQRMGDAYARNKKTIKEGKSLETGTQLDFTDVTPANEKTLKKMGLWDYKSVFSMDELDGIITRTQAKGIVTPDIPGFTKAQAERLGKIDELKSFYKNLTIDQIIPELDHKTPLKLTAYLMDKTTGAKRVAIRKTILDEGIYLAEMAENMQALPREVHAIWTRNMNKYLGKTHKNFQDTFLAEMKVLGITDELDIAKEFARRIKAARETFDVAFDAHKISYGTEWVNNVDDLVNKLDEAFEAGDEWAPRRSTEAIEGINASLADLDELPLNNLPSGNEGLEQVVGFLKAKLKELGVPKLSEMPQGQVLRTLEDRTGMSLNDINRILQTYNIDSEEFIRKLFEVAE